MERASEVPHIAPSPSGMPFLIDTSCAPTGMTGIFKNALCLGMDREKLNSTGGDNSAGRVPALHTTNLGSIHNTTNNPSCPTRNYLSTEPGVPLCVFPFLPQKVLIGE